MAEISGLNVVVQPGVSGKATFKAQERPWDEVLERVLAPNGLSYRVEGNVLRVAPPEQLTSARSDPTSPRAVYNGRPIDVWFTDRDLREGLEWVANQGRATVTIDPVVSGRISLKLNQVPWDQAFDLIVKTNGLIWTRAGDALTVAPKARPAAVGAPIADAPAVTALAATAPSPHPAPAAATPSLGTSVDHEAPAAPHGGDVAPPHRGDLVSKNEPGLILPEILKRPRVVKPKKAVIYKISGMVVVDVLVDEEGRSAETKLTRKIEHPMGQECNTAALQAVRATTWRPATKDGVPVKVWIPVQLNF
jgi:hypothetical protein